MVVVVAVVAVAVVAVVAVVVVAAAVLFSLVGGCYYCCYLLSVSSTADVYLLPSIHMLVVMLFC